MRTHLASCPPSLPPQSLGGGGSPPATLIALQSVAVAGIILGYCAVSWGIMAFVVYALS